MTITDTQIDQLSIEAACAGDLTQVRICNRALDGDDDARAECARVLASAAAQDDADLYDEANERIANLDDETLTAAIAESLATPEVEGWI